MNKPFTLIAIALLSVIALLQLLRFILGWVVAASRIFGVPAAEAFER